MSVRSTLRKAGSILALASLTIGSAYAITAPPLLSKDFANAGMIDARVNLKSAYLHATAARPGAADNGFVAATSRNKFSELAARGLKKSLPGINVKYSSLTGAPVALSNAGGWLSAAPSSASSEQIVRQYLGNHADLFGLSAQDQSDIVVLGDSAGSGLRMLRVEQQVNGIPIFQSESRFLLTRDGKVAKYVGQLVPGAHDVAPDLTSLSLRSPVQALSDLLAFEGRAISQANFSSADAGNGRVTLTGADGYVAGDVSARKVYFPLSPGLLVPAWSLVVFTSGESDWYAVVDAETGDLLWRKNIRDYASAQDARFRVFVQADGVTPADSPAPLTPKTAAATAAGFQAPGIAQTIVGMHTAMDAVASPNGWINDCPVGGCTANETQTLGNNVIACMDRTVGADANVCDTDAGSVIDGNGRPIGNPDANGRNRDFLGTAPRDFETGFVPPPQGGNPEAGQTATGAGNNGTLPIDQFRRGMLTHLFYVVNWYHDQLYKVGFDEAAGNFQVTNFSGQGLGNDRVLADAQDGSGTNNANFSTPPDGTSGRMQMYRFTGPTIDRDGGLDAEISMHELTHGTSNRLVGNAAGLNWDPARGMGEGWSDFYALSLLNGNSNANDPNGRYASGAYATYKLGGLLDNYTYGIRRFPYSTDHSVNPLTWADVDDVTNNLSGGITPDPLGFNNNGAFEVHNIGEIWALTLWGVRARIIADPAGANGDVPTGSHTTLKVVTDGMKMTPINPTFIDARDAILDADCATNACANEAAIWAGFADRGLGYGSAAPYAISGRYFSSHEGVHESFSVPFLDVASPATDVTVDDSADNNNGRLDPGEAVKLSVKLTNPWHAASKAVASATATLTTSTPGVTIFTNSATYGAIAQGGSATGSAFTVKLASSVACGSAIDFTLTTISTLGTTATSFRLRVGNANGTDAVVTYTNPAAAATIVNNSKRGVASQINVAEDFEIAQVKFRIDSLTHPAVGDLTALLRSPFGTGTDLIAIPDALKDLGGTSFVNTVIDDTVGASTATDLLQATIADAPYTKSWMPAYNSPWAALINPALPADSVGALTRYVGQSSKGTWTNLVADVFSAAGGGTDGNGTLNSWSVLLTPVHYDCTAFVASPSIVATKTVAGTFKVGTTVTYTVTITNNGTAATGDNPGHEFVDVLPASLTLVGATATSGTASTSGNAANWDGALAPLGGSVTITITATINAGTGSTVISNQGTVSYDSNEDGTNDASLLTDDPSVGGATDPTNFTVVAPPYIALNPARLLDTRIGRPTIDGLNTGTGPVSGGTTVDLTVLGRGGVALTDVKAVVLNVTATQGSSAGFITVWPTGQARPAASNVNIVPASDVPNAVVVGTGTGGKVSLFISNSVGAVDLIVDVAGYFTGSSSLTLVPASRFLDTRVGRTTIDGQFAGIGPVAGQTSLDVTMTGRAPLPASGVGTVIFNLTATGGTATGFATAWPTGVARPTASTLNFTPGATVPSLALSQVGTGGKVSIFNSAGATDFIADVQAWFPTGQDLTPVTPARILDTRAGKTTIDGQFQAIGPFAPGGSLDLLVTNRAGVPASGVGAVVLSVTVTQPTGMGFLTIWPTSDAQPNSSNLNFAVNQTIANLVIAKVGTGGQISIFNSRSGTTHVIADVVGWLPAAQ